MKIVRNGIEYELTHDEMRKVYGAMHREYLREDIESIVNDMGIELSDKTINDMVFEAEHCLNNNDSYWESYWLTIEYVIKEYKEVH